MPRTGRNDLCHCGSGRKYKKCHGVEQRTGGNHVMLLVVGGAVLAAILVGIVSFNGDRSAASVRIWSPAHGHYHDANGTAVP